MAIYLVCYDITDNRRRYQVAKLLSGYGLRVQKSVFECDLDDRHYPWVKQRMTRLINRAEDQVRFYPLSAAARKQVVIVGTKPEYAIDSKTFIV